ncbi:hypothetical protein AB4Y45_32235 [Paraburkholderia sp. EG287A]|uniref:hypothetical protein n=1 Tax=Paraburkholderia sp. EG287A TaxID=3237012 RepID=UPI0034D1F711
MMMAPAMLCRAAEGVVQASAEHAHYVAPKKPGTTEELRTMFRKLSAVASAVLASLALCSCHHVDSGYTLSKVATDTMKSDLAHVHNLETASFCYAANRVTNALEPWLTIKFADGSVEQFAVKDGGTKVSLDWQFTKATWVDATSYDGYKLFSNHGCFEDDNEASEYFRFVAESRKSTFVEVHNAIATAKPYGAIEGDLKLATRALLTALADHDKRYVEPINTY